jgi:hypothetical protein
MVILGSHSASSLVSDLPSIFRQTGQIALIVALAPAFIPMPPLSSPPPSATLSNLRSVTRSLSLSVIVSIVAFQHGCPNADMGSKPSLGVEGRRNGATGMVIEPVMAFENEKCSYPYR